MSQEQAKVKTYVLLDHLNATAPVYQHIGGGERVKIEKRPNFGVTLRQSFMDKNGDARTIRYKHGSKHIDQSLQIEEEKIDANVPFTSIERKLRYFKNGTLTTNVTRFQEYLENHPGWWKFEGTCEDFKVRSYRLLEPEKDSENLNKEMKKQLDALNAVAALNKEEADRLLLKVYGSFYSLPELLSDSQNALFQFVNECEDEGLDLILSNTSSQDSETTILIGQLINKGLLSYEVNQDNVSLKRNGEWQKVKEISSDYAAEDRHRYFVEFLTSPVGELVLKEMNQMAKAVEKKADEPKVKEDKAKESKAKGND